MDPPQNEPEQSTAEPPAETPSIPDEGTAEEADEVINWSDEEEESQETAATAATPFAPPSAIPPHLQQPPHTLPRTSSSNSFLSQGSISSTKSKHRPPQLWNPILADTEVSPYELEREQRLAQNRAMMLSLGIANASFTEDLATPTTTSNRPKKYKKRPKPSEDDDDPLDRYQKMMELKRSRRLLGETPEMIRGGRDSELGNDPDHQSYAKAFSDNSDNSENDDDDIFDHAGMIGMSKIRKRRLGAGVDLVGGLNNDFIEVEAPFSLGFTKLTIWSVGEIIKDPKKVDDYWSQRHCRYRHQYPIGYKATKSQYGYNWTMTIEEGEEGPLFKVVADDEPDLPEFTGPSPTSPWTEVCMTVLGKNSKTRVSGPHQFGFTDPFLQAVIFGLPNHPKIEDMTTLRLVSRQARRGVRFGGRDGQKKKRGRPKGGNGLMECLSNNVIVTGGMKLVDWEKVLEEERDAELARREERRIKLEAEEKKKEGKSGGGTHASLQQTPGKLVMKAEELESAVLNGRLKTGPAGDGEEDVEMVEVEVEVEEEIVDESVDTEPRIVNGREFRARKQPKKFRKVIKKVLMPVNKKKVKSEPITPPPPPVVPEPVVQKVLTKPPPEVLKRAADPDDDVIYCICDLPESDYWNTVACDKCNIWLHIECVGYVDPETIPKSQHHTIKGLGKDGQWKCPRCRKEVLLVKQLGNQGKK
ncbi:UNVERIFIED_CONTAM: hypothetical protein HDU68_005879 [Siphonaria sp. JEL0065]|nr:hypothetical protein HDU68_005879 [Siphonaria sp. JEL0065]